MMKTVYAVTKIGEDWRIASERRLIGHFKTHDDAAQVARQLVREATASGWDARLSLQTNVEVKLRDMFRPNAGANLVDLRV